MNSSRTVTAGVLLLLAGVFILMGIITAETQYPADLQYSTADNEISDLGATRPPDSVITHPSADIFNVTMVVTGSMIMAAALLLRTMYRRRPFVYVMVAFGFGVLLVGIFPGNNSTVHPLAAMTTFVFGGLSCVTAGRVLRGPFRYVSVALGLTTLSFLVLAGRFVPVMGDGGTERWISYRVVLWLVAFDGYLLATTGAGAQAHSLEERSRERTLLSAGRDGGSC